jgi:hypothetical protein
MGAWPSPLSLLPFDDNAFESWSICRKFLFSIGKTVGRQDVGDNVGITLGAKTAGPTDWHLAHCKREQRADGLFAPALHERSAREFGAVAISLKQPAMTRSACCEISRLAPRCLIFGVDPLPGRRGALRCARPDGAYSERNDETGNRPRSQKGTPISSQRRISSAREVGPIRFALL